MRQKLKALGGRRVPICAINWCCPYRADLCKHCCTGERIPKDGSMLVDGDFVYVTEIVRYTMPEKAKALVRAFDRGEPEKNLVGEYWLEAPTKMEIA